VISSRWPKAWAADWMNGVMQAFDIEWTKDVIAADPALPPFMVRCNADQLRAAAKVVKNIRKERSGK